MPQTFTADSFASGHAGQTDLAAMENNFLALQSHFSGTGAPSNPVAGGDWYDTTSHIYKMRNEANDAWLDFFNLATGRAVDADKCTGITLQAGAGISITHPELSANPTIAHAAHTGHVTGAGALTIASGVITPAMLAAYTAGDYPENISRSAVLSCTNTVYQPKWECRASRSGTVRVRWLMSIANMYTAYGRVYVNDSAVGAEVTTTSSIYAYSDISVNAGDRVQVYIHAPSASNPVTFQYPAICVGAPLLATPTWAQCVGGY